MGWVRALFGVPIESIESWVDRSRETLSAWPARNRGFSEAAGFHVVRTALIPCTQIFVALAKQKYDVG